MLEQKKRILFRISSVLCKVEPEPDLHTGSSPDTCQMSLCLCLFLWGGRILVLYTVYAIFFHNFNEIIKGCTGINNNILTSGSIATGVHLSATMFTCCAHRGRHSRPQPQVWYNMIWYRYMVYMVQYMVYGIHGTVYGTVYGIWYSIPIVYGTVRYMVYGRWYMVDGIWWYMMIYCMMIYDDLFMYNDYNDWYMLIRTVDLHWFFADPDPAVFSECGSGPDPAALKMRIRIQLNKFVKNILMKSFL